MNQQHRRRPLSLRNVVDSYTSLTSAPGAYRAGHGGGPAHCHVGFIPGEGSRHFDVSLLQSCYPRSLSEDSFLETKTATQ